MNAEVNGIKNAEFICSKGEGDSRITTSTRVLVVVLLLLLLYY